MNRIDFKQQREAIRSGFARSNRSVLISLFLIVLLAVFAIWIARQAGANAGQALRSANDASRAEQRAEEELWKAQLARARAERMSRNPGWRQRALNAVLDAARIQSDPRLLNEAVASLAAYDLGDPLVWHRDASVLVPVAFSPDLERCLLLQDPVTLALHRMENRELLQTIRVPEGVYGALGISPNGRWIVCLTQNLEWLVWDAATLELHLRIPGNIHWEYELRPVFSPDGNTLVLCLSEGNVKLIDLTSGTERIIPLSTGASKARLSPDQQWLAIAQDRRLSFFHLGSELFSTEIVAESRIADFDWHPGGRRLALALSNGNVLLLDWESGNRLSLPGHHSDVFLARFHPAGEILTTASWDGSTRFWDSGTGSQLLLTRSGIPVQFDTQGNRLAFGRAGSGYGIWKVHRPVGFSKMNLPLREIGQVRSVDFHPHAPLVVCCDEEEWFLLERDSFSVVHRSRGRRLRSALFSADGGRVFVSGVDGLMVFELTHQGDPWSVDEVRSDFPVFGLRNLERMDLSSDGGTLAMVGYETGALVDARSLEIRFEFGLRSQLLAFAALSPGAEWLAASAWKGAGVHVWRNGSSQQVVRLVPESSCVDFDPQGRWLVTSNLKGYQVWETGSWEPVHQHEIVSGSHTPGPVEFHPALPLLAVTRDRAGIQLIDPETGRERLALTSPDGLTLSWLDFSSDGRFLAAATEHSDIHLWDLQALENAVAEWPLQWPWSSFPDSADGSIASTGGTAFVAESSGPFRNAAIGLILGGMALAVFFGIQSLMHQRRLLRNYDQVERLAEDQNRTLLATELELQQSRKMQALGTLAAGVAHDFNNLLSVIGLSNGFLRRGVRNEPELLEENEAIDKAVQQGREVVASMLGYAREGRDSGRSTFNLNELVEDAVGLLSHQFLSGIRMTFELDRDLPAVHASHSRLEQILLNLIINASEAMSGKGRILVSTRKLATVAVDANVLKPAPAEALVELAVQDSGPGIPADLTSRVFEPFFSTKRIGSQQGTGLGLSTIYTISEQEGFGIGLVSSPDTGCRFQISIPIELQGGPQSPSAPPSPAG